MIKEIVSQFIYNPHTGQLSRKVSLRGPKGSGHLHSNGYLIFSATANGKRRNLRAHRIAFYIMKGYEPEGIDHINRVRNDNRWINLREANKSQNGKNVKLKSNNTSGVKGVDFNKANNIWRARMGKRNLGQSKDFFEICCIRKSAENRDKDSEFFLTVE